MLKPSLSETEKTQVPLGWPNSYKFYSTTENAILEI